MIWIRADKGVPNEYARYKKNHDPMLPDTARKFIGSDIHVVILLSDEILVVRKNFKDFDNFGPNEIASLHLKEPVYGPCLLLDPEEFDYDDWVRECSDKRDLRSRNRVCQGEGTCPSGR